MIGGGEVIASFLDEDKIDEFIITVMRALGDTPWSSREFVVKDRDGRLLAFGAPRISCVVM
jgi:dihydrofolate reductase